MEGRRHVFKAEMKSDRRTRGAGRARGHPRRSAVIAVLPKAGHPPQMSAGECVIGP